MLLFHILVQIEIQFSNTNAFYTPVSPYIIQGAQLKPAIQPQHYDVFLKKTQGYYVTKSATLHEM